MSFISAGFLFTIMITAFIYRLIYLQLRWRLALIRKIDAGF